MTDKTSIGVGLNASKWTSTESRSRMNLVLDQWVSEGMTLLLLHCTDDKVRGIITHVRAVRTQLGVTELTLSSQKNGTGALRFRRPRPTYGDSSP